MHAHILPGLDDGPATMADALRMASIAVQDGIGVVVATPHCLNGLYVNDRDSILSACREFNQALAKSGIPLQALPGAEVRLGTEILHQLETGQLMTLNDTGRYFFLELPDQFLLGTLLEFIARVKEIKATPIIAHPERNMAIQRDVMLLHELVSAGALSQITGSSLTGGFGPPSLRCCLQIINLKLAHFMATDAHSIKDRPPRLSKAFEKLSRLTGRASAVQMVLEAPQWVLEGKEPGAGGRGRRA